MRFSDNGSISTWDVGEENNGEDTHKFFLKYLKLYLNILKDCGITTTNDSKFSYEYLNNNTNPITLGTNYSRFYLSDGTFIVLKVFKSDFVRVGIFIDINGQKKPNKMGKDVFVFMYILSYENLSETTKNLIGKFVSEGAACKYK